MPGCWLIESHRLSNGDLVRVKRHGRKYWFERLFYVDQAPDVTYDLCKADAMNMLADAIKNDVLEVD